MYRIMFISGLVCFCVFLLISMVLFVKNDIAKLIGDLTGWNAKRTIRKMNKEKMDKAKADQESGLGNNISVRTSELFDDIIKKDEPGDKNQAASESKTKTEERISEPVEDKKPSVSNGIFQAEEDMTVLGGEAFKRVSSKTREEDVSYEAEDLEDPETGILSNSSYADMLDTMSTHMTSGKMEEVTSPLVGDKDKTEEMIVDETMVLETEVEVEEGTVVLEEFTSVLSEKGELKNAK